MKKLSDGSDYFRMLIDALGKRLSDSAPMAYIEWVDSEGAAVEAAPVPEKTTSKKAE
jgi:hypothetical protein